MKKLISILALISSVLVMAAMFTGCGDDKKSGDISEASSADAENGEDIDDEEDDEEDEEEEEETEAASRLLGTWSDSENNSYTFNEDGTGTYNDQSFTYTEKNFGLSITFEGDSEATPYDYAVAGTKLIIKDAEQKEFVYEKK